MEDEVIKALSALTDKKKFTVVWNQTERLMVDVIASTEMEAYELWRAGKWIDRPESIDVYQPDPDDYFIEEVDMQEEDFE